MISTTTATILLRSLRGASKQSIHPVVVRGGAVTRGFAMMDKMKSKEKVEEDRYMREQELKFYDRKKTEAAQAMAAEELQAYLQTVAPTMVEVQELLKRTTGESISDAGLEALARWKLSVQS